MLRNTLSAANWNHGPNARLRVVALVWFVFVSLGVPLPSPASAPNTSGERFPCEGHACGCATAAKCWTACCCMTQRQKLAWARENGVTPPAFVLEAAEREQALEDELARERAASGRRACCCKKLAAATPAVAEVTKSTCCAQATGACCRTTASKSTTVSWVLLIQAQKCNGQTGAGLLLTLAVAQPPLPVVSPLEFSLVGTWLPPTLVSPATPALLPAIPPPRVG